MTINQVNPTMSRIDRFLISKEWEDHFVGVYQVALVRHLSNHCPILLAPSEVDWGATI